MTTDLIPPLRALVEQAKAAVETIDGEFGLGRSYASLLTEGDADAQRVAAAERAIDALVAMLEPPTDDEREALATRLEREFGSFLAHWPANPARFFGQAAEGVMSDPVWRNRHRGPITDAVEYLREHCEIFRINESEPYMGDGDYPELTECVALVDVERTLSAALEAAEAAR